MIGEFLAVANVTMSSFFDVYEEVLPTFESHEFKFAMSIFGMKSFNFFEVVK